MFKKISFLIAFFAPLLLSAGEIREIDKIEKEYVALAKKVTPAVVGIIFDPSKTDKVTTEAEEGKKAKSNNAQEEPSAKKKIEKKSGKKKKTQKKSGQKEIQKKSAEEKKQQARKKPKRRRSATYRKSGVLISDQGHILTSTSALPKDERVILYVHVFGGKKFKAKLVKRFTEQRLVLLKIDHKTPHFFKIQNKLPQVGSFVMTATDELHALETAKHAAVQTGVVGKVFERNGVSYIETDTGSGYASMGGAIVNSNGELLGVVDSYYSKDRWFCTALAFNKLPDDIKKLIEISRYTKLNAKKISELSRAYQLAAKKVAGTVVTVVGERKGWEAKKHLGDRHKQRPESGHSSGFVVDASGLIVTSYNNIENATEVHVVLPDGDRHKATVMGFDAYQDIALIKIDKTGLSAATLKADVKIKLGYFTIVVGRDDPGKDCHVATGIVSNDKRMSHKAFETDAPVNFANSGGLVVNIQGQVMGMAAFVSESASARHGVNSGVGFCLSVQSILKMLPELKKGLKRRLPQRPFLGVTFVRETKGVVIEKVIDGSSAKKYGLKPKDQILSMNGKAITTMQNFVMTFRKLKVGQKIKLTIKRDTEEKEIELVVGSMPKRS